MNIKAFNTGLITRTHPHLIPTSSAVEYHNCDNEKLSLCPTKLPVKTDTKVKERWIYNRKCDKVHSEDGEVYWTIYEDDLYQMKDGLFIVECDSSLTKVGLDKPELAVTPIPSTGGEMCGTYSYVYTYYNSQKGYESAPSPISSEVSVSLPPEDTPEPVDPLLDEKANFVIINEYIREVILMNESIAWKTEAIMCAVRKYNYTIPRFNQFKAQAENIYANAPAAQKLPKLQCLSLSYPEGYDIYGSFAGMYTYLKQVALEAEDLSDAKFVKLAKCVASGSPYAHEQYGTKFHYLIDKINQAVNGALPTPPPLISANAWRRMQVECIVNETIEVEVEEEEQEEVCNGAVVVNGIKAGEGDTIRLYRLGGTITTYTLVTELNNADQSYTDTASDASIAGNKVLDSFDNQPAPKEGKHLVQYNSMMFASVGSTLRFSDVDKPYAWAEPNQISISETITGLGAVQNGLLVFTRYKTYIVVGNSPSTLARYLLSDEQGCVQHETIAFNNNSLFWLSTDGICTSNGGAITILTQDRLGRYQRDNIINAVVHDRQYILSYYTGCIILDNRYDFCIRTTSDAGWLGTYHDTLFAGWDGDLWEMFKGDNRQMHYISPIFNEGRLTEYKMFKDLYIAFTGDITVKVYIYTHDRERELVFDRKLDPKHIQNDLKLRGNIMGYGLQVEVIGTGCVQEIDFRAVTGRENGK